MGQILRLRVEYLQQTLTLGIVERHPVHDAMLFDGGNARFQLLHNLWRRAATVVRFVLEPIVICRIVAGSDYHA